MPQAPKRVFLSSGFPAAGSKGNGSPFSVVFSKSETHYLRNVLRLKEGALCRLFDRSGSEFVSRLGRLHSDGRLEAICVEPIRRTVESGMLLTVAQAIPQRGKFDRIVEKTAEIGLHELVPLVTERSPIRISPEREEKMRMRWQRILFQTAQQSKIDFIPQIAPVTTFTNFSQDFRTFDETYLFHPDPSAKPLASVKRSKNDSAKILLLVGPEGGFSEAEVKSAFQAGATVLKMGKSIMKTDTAFTAVSSFIKFIYQ